MSKRILVLLKYSRGEIAPFDGAALEAALQLKDAEVTVLSMLPRSAEASLKNITRLGVKAILVSDIVFAGSDTYATSYILANAIKRIPHDALFIGKQSVDGDTGQVPLMISHLLNYQTRGYVKSVKDNKLVFADGSEEISSNIVYVFDKTINLRSPSLSSKTSQVEIWDNKILNLDPEKCGWNGSLTKVVRNYENNQERRFPKTITIKDLDKVIKESLSKDSSKKENISNQKLDEIGYFGDVKDVASKYSKKATEFAFGDVKEVVNKIKASKIKTFLFDDSFKSKCLAAALAIELKSGLCADCVSFDVKDNKLVMIRPAFEGNIIADVLCTSEYSLATVKTLKNSSDIVFGVGKGAVRYLENIKELAKNYGAEVCATRDLVDLNIMPYSSQVGLTGKFIFPKVYVTFGISGAVQHTCGISSCGTIISINIDRKAKIFTYSDYQIIADIKDLFR